MTTIVRKAFAEFVGTFVLVFFAVGAAVFGLKGPVAGAAPLGVLGVALAFGLTLLALAYAIGPLSGCHVNPAVTLGVLLSRGMTASDAVYYWVAQFLGGIAGSAVIQIILSGGKAVDYTGGKGSNNWGTSINAGGAFLLEVILTFLLVLVVLLVTHKAAAPGFAGLAIGVTLTVIHLVGIPLDGTSVNPARSFGPALFAGGEPLKHVWLFIIAPLVGAIIAAFVAPLLHGPVTVDSGQGVDPTGADVRGKSPSQQKPRRNAPTRSAPRRR